MTNEPMSMMPPNEHTSIHWTGVGDNLLEGFSQGTGKYYKVTFIDGVWAMYEGSRLLGTHSTMEQCIIDIEAWDTEPNE